MPSIKVGDIFGTTTEIEDSTGNKVTIPGGFKITQDSGNNVSEGIVIENASEDQFVWIPVNSVEEWYIDNSYPSEYWTGLGEKRTVMSYYPDRLER